MLQYGGQEILARNVELVVSPGDKFLAQAVPPSKWPAVLDLIGIIPSKAAHPASENVAPDQQCRLQVKLNVRDSSTLHSAKP